MYKIIFISSGITAYSNTERGQCMHWLLCNNFDPDTGDCLNLFKLVNDKVKG